jgi:hypothetical protein
MIDGTVIIGLAMIIALSLSLTGLAIVAIVYNARLKAHLACKNGADTEQSIDVETSPDSADDPASLKMLG